MGILHLTRPVYESIRAVCPIHSQLHREWVGKQDFQPAVFIGSSIPSPAENSSCPVLATFSVARAGKHNPQPATLRTAHE
jgi:hypothetical protein